MRRCRSSMNGPNCCDQFRGTPPPMVKIPSRFCRSRVEAKCSRSSKGSKRSLCLPAASRMRLESATSSPNSESVKAGTKTGTPFSKADFRIPR